MKPGFIRLDYTAIQLGKPLKFPVFTGEGKLLLNSGHIVRTKDQLDTLITRGIYQRSTDSRPARPLSSGPAEVIRANVNIFREFDGLVEQLKTIPELVSSKDSETGKRLRSLVTTIEDYCTRQADACLGKVHFQTSSSPYEQSLYYAIICCMIARRLQLDVQREKRLIAAALTANISLFPFQDKLHQSKSSLNDKQREIINKHPMLSTAALRQAGIQDEHWLKIIEQHHERFDGSGYPLGIGGKELMIEAKILAATEHYTALITQRAYRDPINPADAYQKMLAGLSRDDNQAVYLALIEEITMFPPGCLIRLANGEIAIVTHRTQGSAGICPKVKALVNPKGGFYSGPLQRHTDQDEYRVVEWVAPMNLPVLNLAQIWGIN